LFGTTLFYALKTGFTLSMKIICGIYVLMYGKTPQYQNQYQPRIF